MKKNVVDYYNKIAKDYTAEHSYGEQLSILSLEKFLTFTPPNAKVLDVGCGGGQDSKFLHDKGCEVLGIDLSEEMIKLAKEYAPEVDFKVIDLMDLENSTQYDGIWCSRVFHNISIFEHDEFFRKVDSLLKNGGILYLTSVVSNKDIEDIEEIKNGLIIKRMTEDSFKELTVNHGYKLLSFKYWKGLKGMEIIAKKHND